MISWPASTSASSVGTAKSGVPMKMIRMVTLKRLYRPSASPDLADMSSPEIDALTQALARLPGLGPRSARRAVLHLLQRRDTALAPLLRALESVNANMVHCTICGNVDT